METKKTILFIFLLIASSCKTGLITDELKKGVAIPERFDFSKWENDYSQYKKHEYSDSYILEDKSEVYISDNELDLLPPKPLFYLEYKEFYDNGSIKQRGKYFGEFKVGSNSTKIGMWYEFDEKGNLKKQTDEDTKFGAFGYNDVLRFLDKKGAIGLHNGKNREKLQINYYYLATSNKKVWVVRIKIGEPTQIIGEGYRISQKRKSFFLDGNTGEEILYKNMIQYRDIIPGFENSFSDLK
jgi:hypothetical protein